MRKLLYLISSVTLTLAILLSLNQSFLSVQAKIEYRRVITQDTPFYSDADGANLLFYLPYTYYVRIIEYGETLTHVECFGTGSSIALDGYAPTEMLYPDELPVQNPYMEKEITTISTAVLYADRNLTIPLQYIFSSRTLKYYGQTSSDKGANLFYVGYNNKLGYVEENTVMPFEIPLHPNELTFIKPEQPPEQTTPEQPESEQPTNNTLTIIRIVVIACLLLAGVIGLLIAIKNKPKTQTNTSYYDENEYE